MSEGGDGEGGQESATERGLEGAAQGESWLGRAAHIAEWGAEALKIGGPAGEFIEKGAPMVGALAGGASAGINLGLAANDFSKEGAHSDKGYEHLGGAALGGAGAALSCTPYGVGLAAAEVGTDLVGKGAGKLFGKNAEFSADSVAGGLIRGTMGDKSLGWGAGSWVSDHLGGGTLGKIAGTATGAAINLNPITMGMNLGKTVGSGLWDEGKAIWGGLNDKSTPAGKAVSAVGSGLSSAGSAIGGAAKSAWGGIKSVGSSIAHFLSDERLKTSVQTI